MISNGTCNIFSNLFYDAGRTFYFLYKIARDIFGTAGAGEPAQLPAGQTKTLRRRWFRFDLARHHLQGSSHLNPLGGDCNGENSIAGGCDGGGGGGGGGGGD
ncbi:hypothetical protein ACLB1E_34220 [Escherichia coli]